MELICGIDEAGRGPVIGPMVMAGVLIEKKDEAAFRKLKIKDSKKVAPIQREILYDKIIAIAKDHAIRIIRPEEIDAAVASETLNLNWLEARTTADIINTLKPEIAQVDCPSTNTGKYTEYLKERLEDKKIKLVVEHKADEKYIASSAASILAKVTRDREIKALRERYGDFGSGYPSDEKTQEFIKKNYKLPIFRRSWATWQAIKSEAGQKKLGDF